MPDVFFYYWVSCSPQLWIGLSPSKKKNKTKRRTAHPEGVTCPTSIALMHVYVTQATFATKPRFEIKNKRSFTEMNSQGSRVEKNTHAQKVQMQKILFTNEACW